jgi:hypothetical protein
LQQTTDNKDSMRLCALVLALMIGAGDVTASAASKPRPDRMSAKQKKKKAQKYKPHKFKAAKKRKTAKAHYSYKQTDVKPKQR